MTKVRAFDKLQFLVIDMQYTIADIVHEVDDLHIVSAEYEDAIRCEAHVVDVAARQMILSIQSALSEATP
jgi:hypothetical protein